MCDAWQIQVFGACRACPGQQLARRMTLQPDAAMHASLAALDTEPRVMSTLDSSFDIVQDVAYVKGARWKQRLDLYVPERKSSGEML